MMKKHLTILTLLFTLMFSSISYAEWTKVAGNVDGTTYYVDFDRIREVDGYVYFWSLHDYLKPNKLGDLSAKVYAQGDCKLFRIKVLDFSFFKEPMGEGTGKTGNNSNPEWQYPPPKTPMEVTLKLVCDFAKLKFQE